MRLVWDDISSRIVRAGVDHGVLYPLLSAGYGIGVAWNGITNVDDTSTGHEKTPLYSGDYKKALLFSKREESGTIKCFTFPEEFYQCMGNEDYGDGLIIKGRDAIPFGLSYRRLIGNAAVGLNLGYELHIIYQAYLTEHKDGASTIDADASIDEMSFPFDCLVEEYEYGEPVSHIVLDSRYVDSTKLKAIEDALYGEVNAPMLLRPTDIYNILNDIDGN